MSVQKFRVTKECSGFTSLPNSVLQNLDNLQALGLWASLASRPSDWEFNKKQIQTMFHIGRDKLFKIMAVLKKHNLLEVAAIKNEKGQIVHWNLHVKNGDDFVQDTENQYSGKTTLLKNQTLDSSNLQKKERTIQRKEYLLPKWLSVQDWTDFLEHRKHLKAPLSEEAKKRAIATLQKLRDGGANISDVIHESIVNGWKGLFPIPNKTYARTSYANKQKSNSAIHFESGKSSLKGTKYDPEGQDPFSQKSG